MQPLYSYAVKLGGSFHIVKDSEVDGLFQLIQFKMRMSRAQAERILHEGGAIREDGHFVVTALRKHRAEFLPDAVRGFVSSRVQ